MTQRGQAEVRWSSTYLRREEQGQRLTAETTLGSAKIEGAEENWRGEGSGGAGGEARGKDHITLRTSKQSRQKKERRSRMILSGAVQQLCLKSPINKPRA